MHTDLFQLDPGASYALTLRGAMQAAARNQMAVPTVVRRTFLGYRTDATLPCIEVARANGKTQLLSIASIATADLIHFPD